MIPLTSLHLVQVDTLWRTAGFILNPVSWYKIKLQPGKSGNWELHVHKMNSWLVIYLLQPALCHCFHTWQAWARCPWQRVCLRLALIPKGAKQQKKRSCPTGSQIFLLCPISQLRSVLLEIHQEIWFRIRTACSKTVSLISAFQMLLNAWLCIQSRNS